MRKHILTTHRPLRLAWAALAVTCVGVFTATGADRMVLGEYFTRNGCSHCAFAGPAMNMMLNNHPGTFTAVEYHVGDGYATTWGNSRATFYAVPGTPDHWLDGVTECLGSYDDPNFGQDYNWYNSEYNNRRAVPTDVKVQMTGVLVSGSTYTIRARVCLEAGGTAKNVRVYMVQVLDHWPTSPTYSRNTFKQAASTQNITPLSPGQCQTITRTFTFDGTSWADPNNIKIITWVQQPNASGPAEVYQAAVMGWPFPGDCNANGAPDPDDIASGTSQDCNGNSVPDECDIAAGTSHDCNTNGVPDECDIATGTSHDCNTNTVPDECDIATGTSHDCNANGVPDECDIAIGTSHDCNTNGVPDECDIAIGTSQDENGNGIPDECETCTGDANCDGVISWRDIDYFVAAMNDSRSAWWARFLPGTPKCVFANSDVNQDGHVSWRDISPFVNRMNTTCPH